MKTFMLTIIILLLAGCSSLPSQEREKDSPCISGNCTNGYGTFKYNNGDRYVGYFSNGKRNGQGTYSVPNRVEYSGNWINDDLTGKCNRRENNSTWVSGNCRDIDNSITFSDDAQEMKRQVSKERAKKTLERIRRM